MALPLALVLALLLVPARTTTAAEAGETHAPESAPRGPAESPPSLSLDKLLRVPPIDSSGESELRGGRDRESWSKAFAAAHEEVEALEGQIEEKQARLRDIAPDDWGFSPTGTGPAADPEVMRIRAELRRDRQSLETARRRLRDLEIEASLAGVPESWRTPAPEPPSE